VSLAYHADAGEREHTIALARVLRGLTPRNRRRRRRLPRQQQPDGIRLAYYRELEKIADAMAAWVDARVAPTILRLLDERREQQADALHIDGPPPPPQLAFDLIDEAARRFADIYRPEALEEVVRSFGKRTSDFQQEQLDRQVRAAMGVDLVKTIPDLGAILEPFAAANVALIKTLSPRYFDDIRLHTERAFTEGMHGSTFAKELEERHGVSKNRAKVIARDQIGKLNGQLNMERQTALGVDGYIWRTMRDGRVRDDHEDLDGERFLWSRPPPEGHPGEPVQCRCYAEPDLSVILEAL
jgi:SPP1 gp7 family putative phage head morphogenesis protein